MTASSISITRIARFDVASFATRNDGSDAADMLRLSVIVTYRANASTGDVRYAIESAGRWLAQYLNGHDASASLDFAPTLDRLACYLLAVFEQFSNAVATVEVRDISGESVLVTRS